MKRYGVILLLGILQVAVCRQKVPNQTLEVTYIANEGFMVSMGNTKVLIDPLPKSSHYAQPSDTLASRMIQGVPPFEKIDYVLVTHDHSDHFNADLMSRFLLNHPSAQFIASPQTCSMLTKDSLAMGVRTEVDLKTGQHRIIRRDKTEFVALRLEHGGWPDVNNLAFLVRSNGYTMFHTGDAVLSHNEESLRTIDWASYKVDLLFLEYFDKSDLTKDIIKSLIKPKHVILMHIPPGEEDSVRAVNSKIHPRTVVFGKEGETKRFNN